ncbi:conserved hypothetical protein [Ricinus communis]|uniref:Uncharacterized protein n=1 Tax=Ricinus communis TaxID=3988 RepID=B9RWV2_RICCO|nr:conserved hypothetical protein [Ricinus communis]
MLDKELSVTRVVSYGRDRFEANDRTITYQEGGNGHKIDGEGARADRGAIKDGAINVSGAVDVGGVVELALKTNYST